MTRVPSVYSFTKQRSFLHEANTIFDCNVRVCAPQALALQVGRQQLSLLSSSTTMHSKKFQSRKGSQS